MQSVSHVLCAQSIQESVATEIKKGQTVISKGDKTTRLVFEAANKRTDINVAIASNPDAVCTFMKDRRWAPMKVKIGNEEKEVFVNINSLCKRLGLQKSDVYKAIKEHTLENLVASTIATKLREIESQTTTVAADVKAPEQKIAPFIERVKGALMDAWWSITTGGWDLFRFRFLIGASDEDLQKQGQLLASEAFHNAYARVPAYKTHVDTHGHFPECFTDIPLTGKKEYIQKAVREDDLFLDGTIPKDGQLDSSTGTTGEPSLWMRSHDELAMTQKLMSFVKKAKFGDEDIILVNTFALGLWATGITLAGAGPKHGLTANIGIDPEYVSKTVKLIKNLTTKDSQRPIVLCGYPPNVRNIAAAIQNDPELSKRNLKLHAIVGGEGMTEDMRKEILDKGFTAVFSSYGASDLDINIGYETQTEVAIRQACIDNPELAKELYGGGPPPMIFNYDPLHYFIETTKDGELVFTCCRKERASPRIRYNLHDTGKVMKSRDVVAICKKYGIEITPRTNLPFLFVHGREGSVSHGAAKIHYEHLEEAIRALDNKKQIHPDRFALHKPSENELEFWIEASTPGGYDALQENIEQFKNSLITKIAESNTDFGRILASGAVLHPKIRIFKPGQSPMSIHFKQNPHRKLQRVVTDSPEVKKQLQEHQGSWVLS